MMAKDAFDKLVRDHHFETVLDVGSGAGLQSKAFKQIGKQVAAVDLGRSIYFNRSNQNYEGVRLWTQSFDNFVLGIEDRYDVVWLSHVLEHQVNPNSFLHKCRRCCKENTGLIAVTVPPLKHSIVGGHVTLWNAGLLVYHMILAGIDCRTAGVKTYGYNISVIAENRQVPQSVLDSLHSDAGDIVRLQEYFPFPVKEGFDGRISEVNW